MTYSRLADGSSVARQWLQGGRRARLPRAWDPGLWSWGHSSRQQGVSKGF